MFECDRCGSSYSSSHVGVEHCPRCQLLDRVTAPLAFKVFPRAERSAPPGPYSASGLSSPGQAPVALAKARRAP